MSKIDIKNSKKVIIIIIAVVLVAILGGVAIRVAAINVEERSQVIHQAALEGDSLKPLYEIVDNKVLSKPIEGWKEEEKRLEEEKKRLEEEARAKAEAQRREQAAEEARARAAEEAARAAEEEARKAAEEEARKAAEAGESEDETITVTYPTRQIVNPGEQVVICLDPGHGGSELGARYEYDGILIMEKDQNYYIAMGVKSRLEAAGIKVIMTRTGDYNPNLYERVKYGKDNGAHYFVSLHNNASSKGLPEHKGCLVIVTQSNYNDVKADSIAMAQSVLSQLTSLGINLTSDWDASSNGGLLQRIDDPLTYYPDDSVADWYGIIRNSTYQGLPSILIEHAFLSNSEDYYNYLSTPEKLDALAAADANGIIAYLRGKGYL